MPTQKSESKARGRPIQPGQVLNPGGRPKVPKEIVATCRELTPEVVEFWRDRMRDEGAKDADRLRASENIFDRAYGKAVQAVEASISEPRAVDTTTLTDAQRDALAALAVANMGLDSNSTDGDSEQ